MPAPTAPRSPAMEESGLASELAKLVQAPSSDVRANLPRLETAFGSSNPSLRILAVVLAGRAGPGGLSILSRAQDAKSANLRQFAAMGLGQMGPGTGAVEGLARAVQDGDAVTAKVASAALGRSPDAASTLRGLARSSDPRVAAMAVRSLGQVTEGSGQLAPELAAARRSPDPNVALAAVESAVRVDANGGDALAELIGRLAGDSDPAIRAEAAAACGRLMDRAKGSEVALREAIVSDPEAAVRANAAISLALVGRGEAATVNCLARALGDRDSAVQKASIMALHNLENKAAPALPALRALNEVADDEMRGMINATIERIAGP